MTLNYDRPKRVLLVAYLFPPTGGAGVQRAAKFVKYLPQHGWSPSVLTVSNPSVPVFDDSLTADIADGTIIRRAKTLEPGYALKQAVSASQEQQNCKPSFVKRTIKNVARAAGNFVLQPDSQILWLPDAIREGLRLLDEIHHDAIMVTAPPYSSFLVGATLSRRTGIPLVLDYRDEWDISNAYWENKQKEPVSRWIQARMQRSVVRAASALIATTQSSADSLAKIAQTAGSAASVSHIYNGFDADDFTSQVSTSTNTATSTSPRRYRLSYVGTLWNLTSVEPLVKAVQELSRRAPRLAEQLEIVFVGRRTGPQDQLLDQLHGLPCELIRHDYLDHPAAVELMQSSDGLVVLMSDVPHAGRVVPAKIFEYMAARRSILSITPAGEVSQIFSGCPLAHLHVPSDIDGIVETLSLEIQRHQDNLSFDSPIWDADRFNREHLAGELADVLDGVLDGVTLASKEQPTDLMAAV